MSVKRSKRRVPALVVGLVLVVAAGAGYWHFGRAVAVPIVEAVQGTVAQRVVGPGTLQARVPVTLAARITATVQQVNVDIGDEVRRGQALVQLDDRDLAAKRGVVGAQQTALARNVDAAKASVAKAQAELELARSKQQRDAELLRSGFVSQAVLDGADAALRAAQANLDNARATHAARAAEASALQHEARYADAVLSFTRIVAPMDGVIIARQAEVGTTVVPGSTLLRMVDPATLWVAMSVDESVLARVLIGQVASIRMRSGEVLPGKVARITHQSDAATRELEVNIAFDKPPARFDRRHLPILSTDFMLHNIDTDKIKPAADSSAFVRYDAMPWRCAEALLTEAGWTLHDLPQGQVGLGVAADSQYCVLLQQRPKPNDVVDGHGLLRAAGAGALDFALATSVSDIVLVDEVLVGLNWTWLRAGRYCGIARSPDRGTEGARSVLAGSPLAGRPLAELASWLCSLDPMYRSIGLAAINAFWNRADGPLASSHNGLERFEPLGDGLVVVGGFREALKKLPMATVIERELQGNDVSVDRAQVQLSNANAIAITAQTLMNGSLEPLLARVNHIPTKLLLGPSAPVSPILFEHGLTAVSGLTITDPGATRTFIAETGAMIMLDHLTHPLGLDK